MSLRAGTVRSFEADSLAGAIEAAFAAELRDAKDQPLPAIGAEDRRVLFAAIAQGVLAFLARNDVQITVDVRIGSGGPLRRGVEVAAPTLTASGTSVTGEGWPAGAAVRLVWSGTGASAGAVTARNGRFALTVAPPAGGDWLGARDASGNAAAVRIG